MVFLGLKGKAPPSQIQRRMPFAPGLQPASIYVTDVYINLLNEQETASGRVDIFFLAKTSLEQHLKQLAKEYKVGLLNG